MKITNQDNLPSAIANYRDYHENVRYSRGQADYSATTLIGSPRMRKLFAKHRDEITQDAAEDVFSMLGSALHSIVEHGAGFDDLVEERLYMEVGGKTISGAIDLQEFHGKQVDLYDFKVTSVWAYIIDNLLKPDWIEQQNIYAELFRHNKPDFKLRSINVCVLFRDWSKTESTRRHDYPQKPIMARTLPMWPRKKVRQFIEDRVKVHSEADEHGAEMPLCSDTDRWLRPGKFALMRRGRKSALKLFDTYEEAYGHGAEQGINSKLGLKNSYYVEERPSTYVRCESWCNVAPFCSQHKAQQMLDDAAKKAAEKKADGSN